VVPEKRKLMVGGAALAAAFALAGCAPAGYNGAYGNNTGGGAVQAADSSDASPSAQAPADAAADDAGDDAAAPDAPELTDEQTTDDLTAATVKKMGETVQDEGGWVLYRFDDDQAKPKSKSNCNGDCAKIWPPALTNDGKPKLKGIDPKVVGTVTRADGTKQLTIKGWPVYRYIGDVKPGTWHGQNVAGKWFVIKPDGTKNLTCLPKISKPVAPPKEDPADAGAGSGDSGSAGGDYSY
jgi:predicted lipoprotein with Yx(FWY)xxD motif